MKRVTLNIPENKYKFFIELVSNLGFEKVEDIEIPEQHMDIVRERIKKSDPDELISWKEAQSRLRFSGE